MYLTQKDAFIADIATCN